MRVEVAPVDTQMEGGKGLSKVRVESHLGGQSDREPVALARLPLHPTL